MKIDSSACKIPKKGSGGDSLAGMKKVLLPLAITDKDPVNKDNSIVCALPSIAAAANVEQHQVQEVHARLVWWRDRGNSKVLSAPIAWLTTSNFIGSRVIPGRQK